VHRTGFLDVLDPKISVLDRREYSRRSKNNPYARPSDGAGRWRIFEDVTPNADWRQILRLSRPDPPSLPRRAAACRMPKLTNEISSTPFTGSENFEFQITWSPELVSRRREYGSGISKQMATLTKQSFPDRLEDITAGGY
jgi:hypothetical protein